MNEFPLGKAALFMLIMAAASGVWLGLNPVQKTDATLVFWTFARNHFDTYKEAILEFEAAHPGVKIDLQLVHGSAVTSRLQAAFQSDLPVPDLVETAADIAGIFFRGPVEHIGFEDLTDRIHKSGLWDSMLRARFSAYTHKGRIFGLPHDVHPIMMAYRRDIFEQEGIDPREIKTWDDFIRIGRKITIPGKRYMLEAADNDIDALATLLYQRGGSYFSKDGKCLLDSELSIQNMLFYVPLVAGPNRIGGDLGKTQILTRAVEDGYVVCLMCPDWRTKIIESDIPRVSGKMALMPLPAFTPGGRRTSVWPGTMLAMTKACKNKDLAWEFATFIYTREKGLDRQFSEMNILPAFKDVWKRPVFRQPRKYWSGQRIGQLYINLTPQIPKTYSSPYILLARQKYGEALVACCAYYRKNGEKGFKEFTKTRLKQSADEVRAMIRRNPY